MWFSYYLIMFKFSFKDISSSTILSYIGISLFILLSYFLIFKFSYLDKTLLFSLKMMLNFLNLKLFIILLIVFILISFFLSRLQIKTSSKKIILFLFLLAFILSTFSWGVTVPNPDVVEFFGIAKYVHINGIGSFISNFGSASFGDYRFHIMPILIGLLFQIFGESVWVVYLSYSFIFAFIPVLTYLLSKKLFSKNIALSASILVISFPIILIQSTMFLVDIPTILFVLLAIYTFILFLEKPSLRSTLVSFLSISLAVSSKASAIIFLVLPLITIFLIYYDKSSNKKYFLKKIIPLFAILFLIAVVFIFTYSNYFVAQSSLDLSQLNIVGNPDHFVPWYSLLFQINPIIMLSFLVFLVLFISYPSSKGLILISWFILPLILFKDVNTRYLFPAFPALAIAASISLSKLKKPLALFTVILVLLSSVALFSLVYIPAVNNTFYDSNIKLTGNYLNSLDINSVGVYTFYENLTFTYSPKTEIYAYLVDFYSKKRVYYDLSGSVKEVYSPENLKRYVVFDYYKDDSYFSPNYDSIVILSSSPSIKDALSKMNVSISSSIEENYVLDKVFSNGYYGIEPNKHVYIFLKASLNDK